MKRASFREACHWVAFNDSTADDDSLVPAAVASLVSSILVADIFDVSSAKVAQHIIRYRMDVLIREHGARAARAQREKQIREYEELHGAGSSIPQE